MGAERQQPERGMFRVASISSKGLIKRLKLSDGRRLEVHRFACVGEGDTVIARGDGALSVKTEDGDVTILPHYKSVVEFDAAQGRKLLLETQEITLQAHFEAYESLSQYHYRNQNSFGRRAILLLVCRDLDFPRALGFVEITTAFINLKNRSILFDAPFESEPGRCVKWSRWDKETRLECINTIARISRIVVHPEVRGIGLSRVLIGEAEKFCKERWNVHGQRALFLEITADMLKFMPFVYSAGMHWIGDSSGNRDRVVKDMRYLEAKREHHENHWINRHESRGIASKQRKDIDKIIDLKKGFEQQGLDIFLQLSHVARGDEEVGAEIYEALASLVRFPKPTFLKGLTRRADAFVTSRCVELGLDHTYRESERQIAPCSSSLRIRSLNLAFDIDTGVLGTSGPGTVRRAFGLTRQFSFRTGIRDLTVEVSPGEICYVYGSSGSGKTRLLELISRGADLGGVGTITGHVFVPNDGRFGFLEDEWPNQPLLSAIGAGDLNEAIEALNVSGLAEPRLYLSRWSQLSAGQKYRAQLARLMCSDTNIWLLDEFASNLDDATALSVGRNFARVVRKRGIICFIATVRRAPLINAVAPDKVIHLDQVAHPVVSSKWQSLAEA